jgi:LmbE family N-acetylglucosaminyl deacetylase
MNRLGMLVMLTAAVSFGAGPAPRRDGAKLYQDLRKLSVLGTALYVAAHPDDENTRLLASLANESLVRAAYLSFTRGEGGQNLIGPELGPLLGVIRTQELLAARRIDGAEQFFTRARDFGYSKSVDETLTIWDHDRVLADAVWVIRLLRPDVIITRFALDDPDTHGHHTASARLALEAFHAAADPKFHPEQLDKLSTWQAHRIVWNAWAPEGAEKLPQGTVTGDSSQYNPVLGLSYGELAADSRSMHKSQGFGAAPAHGPVLEYFAPLAGNPARTALFDGIDLSWKRVPGSDALAALLRQAVKEFKIDAPEASVATLVKATQALRALPPNPWKQEKLNALTQLIADCAGLFVEATSPTFQVTPGGTFEVVATALNRSSLPVTLEAVSVRGATNSPRTILEKGKSKQAKFTVNVEADVELSTPYWLRSEPARGTWTIPDQVPLGLPENPPVFVAEFRVTVGGETLSLMREVAFKWTDPTMGERFRPMEVLPPVVLKTSTELVAFTDNASQAVRVTVTANVARQSGSIQLEAPAGFSVTPQSAPFQLEQVGHELELRFDIKPTGITQTQVGIARAIATVDSKPWSQQLSRVDYPHIPKQTVLPQAHVKLMRIELKRGKTQRVGYIVGAGDDVPLALRQVGYEVTVLGDQALRTENLSRFEAIVVGIRAYNTNPRLPTVYPRLMDYVKNGGTMVVQYNTRNWLSSVPAEIGPYPFEISHQRVTDENAPVTLAKHRLFQTPNALRPEDFDGWVQERGLYFASKWDPHYETPMSMHDTGEDARSGALLHTSYGKGRFVYTGVSFFRQLPAGIPGAYRLFANILDHGR